ncbi:MAG: methylmalonyl Co-A mutase-associated GTPase MeaB, partial [Chloroflexota bacterium]
MQNHRDLIQKLLSGSKRALARAITYAENDPLAARELVELIHPHTGGAHVIGITGPPGAGKSSLVT